MKPIIRLVVHAEPRDVAILYSLLIGPSNPIQGEKNCGPYWRGTNTFACTQVSGISSSFPNNCQKYDLGLEKWLHHTFSLGSLGRSTVSLFGVSQRPERARLMGLEGTS